MNDDKLTVLITGADGFVGDPLSKQLKEHAYSVVRVCRSGKDDDARGIGDIARFDDWASLLTGIDVVVHLAARAHVLSETSVDPLDEFRRSNVIPTQRLLRAAATSSVKRVVFVSSIGVHGATSGDTVFSEDHPVNPTEPYAISKLEAENSVTELARESGLEYVIVRPPLIYGPRVKGNFLRLLKLVASGLPLPFGAINNRRSYLGLQNFCDLLEICLSHPDASGKALIAADGEDVSTPVLISEIATAMGRSPRLVPIPLGTLRLLGMISGRRAEIERLTASLRVDSGFARSVIGWTPAVPLRRGVEFMVDWYMSESGKR
ncbi:MAG: NAD-dependent epimerase/dehydratase family protein [Gammaproteobacteria bacterium]